MLTKSDLQKIRGVVREEVEAEVDNAKTDLGQDITMLKVRVLTEIDKISNRVKNIEIDLKKVQKDLKYAINFLDKRDIETEKRIQRIEEHLNFPKN